MESASKQKLLQKYDIPVSNLDFGYIKKCENFKEIEKMVLILRSGEEGYFPDLTNCAVDRLKFLHPNSKVLRTEEPVLTKGSMDDKDWNSLNEEMKNWSNEIKEKDAKIRDGVKIVRELPPIRNCPKFETKTEEIKSTSRINSFDYEKWDKYDPDVEVMKMDLYQERNKEFVEAKNKQNLVQSSKILEIKVPDELTFLEKEELAKRHKEKGNEFFKSNEFLEAVQEYTSSLNLLETATVLNNRAIAYIKLHENKKAISDCNHCLKLEPKNIKALLRKSKAFLNSDQRRDAYKTYQEIISIEPNNSTARNAMIDLEKQLTDLPPKNAFRVKIEEIDDEIDFSELIVPNQISERKMPRNIFKNVAVKKPTPAIIEPNNYVKQGIYIEEIYD